MGVKEFFLRKAIWKGIRRAIQVIVSAAASEKLKQAGLNVDQTALTATLTGFSEAGLNWLKITFPNQLRWL